VHNRFAKHIIITGFLGGGKTLLIMFLVLYIRSKELSIITIAMIAHYVIQLSSWYWYKLLCILVDRSNNISVFRKKC